MIALLLSIFTWSKSNFKWIAIALMAGVLVFGFYKYTKLVKEHAIAEQTIVQQKDALDRKDKVIQAERDLAAMQNQILEQQATQINDLQTSIDSVLKDLPDDAKQKAPDSILETLRRLKEITK